VLSRVASPNVRTLAMRLRPRYSGLECGQVDGVESQPVGDPLLQFGDRGSGQVGGVQFVEHDPGR
jgi:hypothetical protein